MRPPNKATLEAKVAAWNSLYKVGQPVVVTLDNGAEAETVTQSEAQILGGHSAVIFLARIPVCYALDRVRARTTPTKD